jgi:hypothetical protein
MTKPLNHEVEMIEMLRAQAIELAAEVRRAEMLAECDRVAWNWDAPIITWHRSRR